MLREWVAGSPLRPFYPFRWTVFSDFVDALGDEKFENDDLDHRGYWQGE